MAIPQLPWYGKLRELVAPTDEVTRMVLLILIAISIALLIWGEEVSRAAWVIYLVSP